MTDIRKHIDLVESSEDHTLHNNLIEWSQRLEEYETKLKSLSKYNGGFRSYMRGDSFDRKRQIEGLLKIGRTAIGRMQSYPEDAIHEGLPKHINTVFDLLHKIFFEAGL